MFMSIYSWNLKFSCDRTYSPINILGISLSSKWYLYFFDRKEFGLDKFVPVSLMESMKRKELRKLLTQLLKFNQEITGTPHKTLTSLQAKLYYLTIMSELPSYGAKCFSTGIRVGCKFYFLPFSLLDDCGRYSWTCSHAKTVKTTLVVYDRINFEI